VGSAEYYKALVEKRRGDERLVKSIDTSFIIDRFSATYCYIKTVFPHAGISAVPNLKYSEWFLCTEKWRRLSLLSSPWRHK
jgi:hypothetical protein